MKTYDKELIIDGRVVRSPEQQVYKNMEDIKTLFQKIQTWYNCSEELEETDNTVLRAYTNVPDSASSGLLIDQVGNMFSITGGDETTLLITFYASIRGPQGTDGAEGSQGPIGYSVRHTSENYVNNSTDYLISNLSEATGLKDGDQVVFANSYVGTVEISGETTYRTSSAVQLGGDQKYEHHLRLIGDSGDSSGLNYVLHFNYIDESSTPITNLDGLKSLIVAKGYEAGTHIYQLFVEGVFSSSSSQYVVSHLEHDTSGTTVKIVGKSLANLRTNSSGTISSPDLTITDKVNAI